ncbi:MAG: preprotein translocase subunit SecE [Acidiferrobacteraceae bacterium]|jgi:preprotein translocase subunit SecE|nr:preprotein translocase subunit SecE [Acidiferrobacteraceae bacterium]MCP4212346.1 preprotein translocase subunit SecE [Halieaceae bacterium]MCP4827608.1 preprotein translocase subunit SecE [Pseudomonadota bacterium]MDP6135047.1 preprotein translocase subunit SecE [Arenicellales bacterium]HJP05814.1 preprotein translocase subunit SecE [Arenicellales bacterium]|tara:strand:+ start:73 stop:423 length:351 start_codon:yes stop_codon:yes gene_type:complete
MVADKLKLTLAALVIVAALALFYTLGEGSSLIRALIVVAGVIIAAGIALTSEPGRAAWQFALATRTEVRKVIWPTRRETAQSTMIVILMVLVVGIYLWLLDALSFWAIYDLALGLG